MSSLYNLRHDGDQYRVTKFDEDLNPESSYLMTAEECTCPAAHRSTCRHRQMFRDLLTRIGSSWLYDYDLGNWIGGIVGHDESTPTDLSKSAKDEGVGLPEPTALGFDASIINPAEVDLTSPRHTFTIPPGHEAIRDAEGRATGETRPIQPPPTKFQRRF